MSLLRTPKSRKSGSTWQRLRDSLFSVERRGAKERKPRRLRVDPLEERTLLSVSPLNPTDTLVNQGIAAIQTTLAGQSVATDHNGDFVVVWTRQDAMLNPDGTPLLDPASGDPMSGTNVYARYFTQQVQRITLPAGVLSGGGAGKYGKFSLVFGGSEDTSIEEVDQISFTQATPSLGGSRLRDRSRDVLAVVRHEPQRRSRRRRGYRPDQFQRVPLRSGRSDGGQCPGDADGVAGAGRRSGQRNGNRHRCRPLPDRVPDQLRQPRRSLLHMKIQPPLAAVDAAWDSGFLPAATVSEVSHP